LMKKVNKPYTYQMWAIILLAFQLTTAQTTGNPTEANASGLTATPVVTSNLETDKPQPGEGLNSFFIRHNLTKTEHLDLFIELNAGKMGANNSLLAHQTYTIPNSKIELFEPLFGKSRERFPLESKEMAGSVYYLISGHGGPDPGAVGTMGDKELHEDEYAYDITLRLAKKLMENGSKIYMIIQDPDDGIRDESFFNNDKHETCMGEVISPLQIARLKQQTHKVNELDKQDKEAYKRCIIIHIDSRSATQRIDVFFYHDKNSSKGLELSNTLRQTFESKYGQHQPSRGFTGTVSDRNLYVLRYTTPVCAFIELGNIQNPLDQQRFTIYENRQALANWLYEGLKQDFKNTQSK